MAEDIRNCSALIVDIAGSSRLRAEAGDVAADRQIGFLLDSIIAAARAHGAGFVKSAGDDVLALFERDPVVSAAEVAIRAQEFAARAGMKLYAGFHFGPVQFRSIDGREDAFGQTINCAARLHKLTEDAPGRIFVVDSVVAALPPGLRALAAPFGPRTLRGIGLFNIWTLDWQASRARTETVFAADRAATGSLPTMLSLRHGSHALQLAPDGRRYHIGRDASCELRIDDGERRVSSNHLGLECVDGHWLLQDISRNGTWMRDRRGADETLLPYCQKALLPAAGSLWLGRPSAEDSEGRFRVDFEIERTS